MILDSLVRCYVDELFGALLDDDDVRVTNDVHRRRRVAGEEDSVTKFALRSETCGSNAERPIVRFQ